MGTKVFDNALDLITFTRASGGTALRRIGYGPELVTNGTFDSDTAGWTAQAATIASVGSELEVTIVTGATNCAFQALSVEIGVPLLVRATGRIGTNNAAFRVGNSIRGFEYVNVTNPSADFQAIIVPTASTIYLSALVAVITVGATAYFDNISVKEVLFDRASDPLVLFNHPDNIPRIEYDASGAVKGLLIEEARTNLLTYSNGFTDASWTKDGTTVASSSNTPFGLGSFSITELATSPEHSVDGRTMTLAGTGYYTMSVWAKQSVGTRYLQLRPVLLGTGVAYANFDLSAGEVVSGGTGGTAFVSAGVIPYGNGWYRCYMTANYTASGGRMMISMSNGDSESPDYLGDGSSQFLVAGAQLEAGSFPTSYIPTSGSTATRAADIASIPTSAFGYNPNKGTLYVDGTFRNGETIATLGSQTITADANGDKDYAVSYSSNPSATSLALNEGTYKTLSYYPRVLTAAQISELTT